MAGQAQDSTKVASKKNTVSDPYLERISAEITEINEAIKASNKKQFERIAELEAIKKHYLSFKKEAAKG